MGKNRTINCKSQFFSFVSVGVPLAFMLLLFQNCGGFESKYNSNLISRPLSSQFAPKPSKIRLLSGKEFANTANRLLGVEVSPSLVHADTSSGYITGGGLLLDETLFMALFREAGSLAQNTLKEI